jgi:hypothetical protein
MLDLNNLIAEREAELAALRSHTLKQIVARHPDASSIGIYCRSDGKGIVATINCYLGKVEEDVPLEEVASCYATENGYCVSEYRLLHREHGLIVRLYISAEKPFTADERKLLAAMGVLKKTRPVQEHLVCRV